MPRHRTRRAYHTARKEDREPDTAARLRTSQEIRQSARKPICGLVYMPRAVVAAPPLDVPIQDPDQGHVRPERRHDRCELPRREGLAAYILSLAPGISRRRDRPPTSPGREDSARLVGAQKRYPAGNGFMKPSVGPSLLGLCRAVEKVEKFQRYAATCRGVCKPLVDSRITQPKRRYRPSQTDGRRGLFAICRSGGSARGRHPHLRSRRPRCGRLSGQRLLPAARRE